MMSSKKSRAGIGRSPHDPGDLDRRACGNQHRQVVGGRVRMCGAAADRATVADLHVADHGRRRQQQRAVAGDQRIALDPVVPDHRADPQRRVALLDAVQPGDVVERDDRIGTREAEVHHRHQAHATGKHLLLAHAPGEQLERLLDLAWRVELELFGQHQTTVLSLARSIAE